MKYWSQEALLVFIVMALCLLGGGLLGAPAMGRLVYSAITYPEATSELVTSTRFRRLWKSANETYEQAKLVSNTTDVASMQDTGSVFVVEQAGNYTVKLSGEFRLRDDINDYYSEVWIADGMTVHVGDNSYMATNGALELIVLPPKPPSLPKHEL
jgi:hypothetical protein